MTESKFDKFLRIGSTFDWITPATAIARGGAAFQVRKEDIAIAQEVLKEAGIKSWAWQEIGGVYHFDVPKKDRNRTQRVLNRSGI